MKRKLDNKDLEMVSGGVIIRESDGTFTVYAIDEDEGGQRKKVWKWCSNGSDSKSLDNAIFIEWKIYRGFYENKKNTFLDLENFYYKLFNFKL